MSDGIGDGGSFRTIEQSSGYVAPSNGARPVRSS
jgi:hypothetical protein